MNNETRATALAWWRGLTEMEQEELAQRFYPDKSIFYVITSSSRIEDIYKVVSRG